VFFNRGSAEAKGSVRIRQGFRHRSVKTNLENDTEARQQSCVHLFNYIQLLEDSARED